MKQHEAVIRVMEENGGFATLGFLYQNVLKVSDVDWKTKTPFASIRRIVQDERFFFKIRPGLWALKTFKNRLPTEIFPTKPLPETKKLDFNHSYYQGLLVEIGNLKSFQTSVPSQDKNKKYLDKTLGEITTITSFYQFGYDYLVKRASTIDVIWFNERRMPDSLFEVEHSTDIQNSLLKFVDLQDFYAKFFIVADKVRRKEFETKAKFSAFTPLSKRVQFINYDAVSDWHTKTYEYVVLEKQIVP